MAGKVSHLVQPDSAMWEAKVCVSKLRSIQSWSGQGSSQKRKEASKTLLSAFMIGGRVSFRFSPCLPLVHPRMSLPFGSTRAKTLAAGCE